MLELLEEPRDAVTAKRWNDLLCEALSAISEANPTRWAKFGGSNRSYVLALPTLSLPQKDRGIIATLHHYGAFRFTHQDGK